MIVPNQTPRLRSARTLPRPFQPDDVAGRIRCGKDPEIIRMFGGSPAFDDPGLDRWARLARGGPHLHRKAATIPVDTDALGYVDLLVNLLARTPG